jgi:hypothetical protein
VAEQHAPAITMTFVKALDVPSAGMSRPTTAVVLRACLVDRGWVLQVQTH